MQDIYNNPFGDYSNQFINDVAIGKSTEITDLVMQQQPENAFCNLTDTMNNINNNKFNNGHDENNFMVDDVIHEEQPVQQEVQNVLVLNDDNNNSNDNFGGPDMGPETDVDTIDEQFQLNAAVGGHKEKTQMEFKETEDVADRADIMNFGEDHSAAIYGTLENKIFEEMTLQNPDLMRGNNPFAEEEAGDVEPVAIIAEAIAPVEAFMDNKFMEEEIQQHVDDFAEKMDNLVSEELNNALETPSAAVEEELIRANMDDAMQQQQLPAGESYTWTIHITSLNGTFLKLNKRNLSKNFFFRIGKTRLNRRIVIWFCIHRWSTLGIKHVIVALTDHWFDIFICMNQWWWCFSQFLECLQKFPYLIARRILLS